MAPDSNPTSLAGPLLIGFLFNTGLFGILTIQTYEYYLQFPNDKLYLRFLASGVFLAEVAQTSLTIYDAYWIFATGFGDSSVLMSIGRMYWVYLPLIGGPLISAMHMFSAHRISILYNSQTLGFIVAAISLAEFVPALVSAAHLREQALRGAGPDIHYLSILIWLAGCVLCDTTIAILMTLWLLRRGDTGNNATRTIIARLLRMTIETGVVIAASAIAGLILLVGRLQQPYVFTIAITSSKFHSVTWLASLNSCTSITRRLEDSATTTGIRFQAMSTGMQMDTFETPACIHTGPAPPPSILTNSVSRFG